SSLRPDVTPRLDAAVSRALAKRPEDRFPTMAAFSAELEACLAEIRSPGGSETMVLPPLPRQRRRPRRPRPGVSHVRTRRRTPLSAILVAIGLAIAVAALVVALLRHNGGNPRTGSSGASVSVTGVGDYPPSSGDTHASSAAQATDGNAATSWYTQHYASAQFGGLMSGLGLLLDAGSSVKLTHITVTSPTPGFVARVLAGDSAGGPLTADSAMQTVGSRTVFALDGQTARYYAVYLTQLPAGGVARISEVTGSR
ncbi:MAG TPA: hypothetical protein VGL76_09585, partial [Gaiellaceae bacterium]